MFLLQLLPRMMDYLYAKYGSKYQKTIKLLNVLLLINQLIRQINNNPKCGFLIVNSFLPAKK